MRSILIGLILIISGYSFAGTDSLSTTSKRAHRNKKSDSQPRLIEQMTDAQLTNLVDRMFEATYIPPDLWEQVMLETARRNLCKINRTGVNIEPSCSSYQAGNLMIQKMCPQHVEPSDSNSMLIFPATNYYDDWDEDLSCVFRDKFKIDTTYIIELENSEFGCYKMPAWGPLSSPFGWRHNRYHKGVDIQLRKGDSITCAFDGMVRLAKKKGGYGNVVVVRHFNGIETVYGHLSKISVHEGDVVSSGDLIGLAGSTGHSTGPHLHFEMRFLGDPIDPQYFISFDYGRPLYNTVCLKKNKNGLLSAYHPETEFHMVERGETLTKISAHYGISIKKLRQLNGWAPKQYIKLRSGMMVRVQEADRLESASFK
ncbi:MAG TPA: M23 family metallopeptidase [Bacteroidia bacterium]|nr:M23 family metallopeptidase [Bacteroidia bacterium]